MIETTNKSGTYKINATDWRDVTCKRSLKAAVSTLEKSGLPITDLSLASTGTVYIRVQRGDFDDYYGLFGDGTELVVRVSDHTSVAGGYSHDGRTYDYTNPDYEIGKAGAEIADMVGVLNAKFDELQ